MGIFISLISSVENENQLCKSLKRLCSRNGVSAISSPYSPLHCHTGWSCGCWDHSSESLLSRTISAPDRQQSHTGRTWAKKYFSAWWGKHAHTYNCTVVALNAKGRSQMPSGWDQESEQDCTKRSCSCSERSVIIGIYINIIMMSLPVSH